jgi:hypothetical protein
MALVHSTGISERVLTHTLQPWDGARYGIMFPEAALDWLLLKQFLSHD